MRLEIAEVVRVQNGAAWMEYDKACSSVLRVFYELDGNFILNSDSAGQTPNMRQGSDKPFLILLLFPGFCGESARIGI